MTKHPDVDRMENGEVQEVECFDCRETVPVEDIEPVGRIQTEEVTVESSPYHYKDPRHNPKTREEPVGEAVLPVCSDCRSV